MFVFTKCLPIVSSYCITEWTDEIYNTTNNYLNMLSILPLGIICSSMDKIRKRMMSSYHLIPLSLSLSLNARSKILSADDQKWLVLMVVWFVMAIEAPTKLGQSFLSLIPLIRVHFLSIENVCFEIISYRNRTATIYSRLSSWDRQALSNIFHFELIVIVVIGRYTITNTFHGKCFQI